MNCSFDLSSVLPYYPQLEPNRTSILQVLARQGTPIFLGERNNLLARFDDLTTSLGRHWGPHVVGYSFKTNYQIAGSGIFRERGGWAEVVSGREYRLARQFGYHGPSIIFNGPYKRDEDLTSAIQDGALVNVNDQDELESLARLVATGKSPLGIGLRISSRLPQLGHSRFGFSLDNGEALMALKTIRHSPQLRLIALHTHLYGDTDDPQLYGEAARRMGEFARDHIPDYESTLRFLDMGGGFPAHSPPPKSRQTWDPQPIDTYVKAIADALHPFFPAQSRPLLVVEPGRYLTCDGILLATRVVHVKQRDDNQIVNCDGSISMIPLTHYCPQVIRAYTGDLQPRIGSERLTIIHGSTCRENDILYQGMFPATERGDYLMHFAAGAYNSSLSPDFIFTSPSLELF